MMEMCGYNLQWAGPAVYVAGVNASKMSGVFEKENNMIRIIQLKLSINHTPEELSKIRVRSFV